MLVCDMQARSFHLSVAFFFFVVFLLPFTHFVGFTLYCFALWINRFPQTNIFAFFSLSLLFLFSFLLLLASIARSLLFCYCFSCISIVRAVIIYWTNVIQVNDQHSTFFPFQLEYFSSLFLPTSFVQFDSTQLLYKTKIKYKRKTEMKCSLLPFEIVFITRVSNVPLSFGFRCFCLMIARASVPQLTQNYLEKWKTTTRANTQKLDQNGEMRSIDRLRRDGIAFSVRRFVALSWCALLAHRMRSGRQTEKRKLKSMKSKWRCGECDMSQHNKYTQHKI